jgi:hypothetical protein
MLKAEREECQLTYNGKHIRITSVFQCNNCQQRILYSGKLFFNFYGETATFQHIDKLKWLMYTKPVLQSILMKIIHLEEDEKHS